LCEGKIYVLFMFSYKKRRENRQHPITLSQKSVGIDIDYYQQAIDDPEVTEERKRELIEIIGAIATNFIDLGFGIHPVQLAQKDGSKNKLKQLSETETPPLQPQFEKENSPERSDV